MNRARTDRAAGRRPPAVVSLSTVSSVGAATRNCVSSRSSGRRVLLLPHAAGPQRRERPERVLLALGDDAEERAVPDDGDDAGHLRRAAVSSTDEQDGAARRRAHDPAVEQPGRAEVVDEPRAAGDLVRARRAAAPSARRPRSRPGPSGRRPRRRRRRAGRGQLPVAGAAAVGRADLAVGDREVAAGTPSCSRGRGEVQRPHLRAHRPQRLPGVLHGQAARGVGLVGAGVGGGGHHLDRAGSTSSSSATIWASAVRTPCPSSTLPDRTSTRPAGSRVSQLSSRGIVLQARVSVIARTASRRAPPGRCGCAPRSGTGCRRAPAGRRPRRRRAPARGARRR